MPTAIRFLQKKLLLEMLSSLYNIIIPLTLLRIEFFEYDSIYLSVEEKNLECVEIYFKYLNKRSIWYHTTLFSLFFKGYLETDGTDAWLLAVAVTDPWGLVAQVRGSSSMEQLNQFPQQKLAIML